MKTCQETSETRGCWLKLSEWGEKLCDPPLLLPQFRTECSNVCFFAETWVFFGEGVIPLFPTPGIPTVSNTHTHTHTHKNTHKGINCRWYDLSYCPTATRHLSRSYYYQVHSCWLSLIATGKYFKGSVHPNYSKSKKKHIFSLTLVQGSAAFTIIPQQENLQNITVSYNEGNEAKKV